MEKQTILAIVLSSLVIFGWFAIQPKLFPPSQAPETEQSSGAGQAGPPSPVASGGGGGAGGDSGSAADSVEGPPVRAVEAVTADAEAAPAEGRSSGDNGAQEEIPEPPAVPETEERILIDTELIRVALSSLGGDMVSYQLKEHDDKGELVEMILPARNEEGGFRESHAFTLAFGGPEAPPVRSYFQVSQPDPLTVEFTRDFTLTGSPGTFTLTKRYEFKPDEYMFQLTVSTKSSSAIAFNFNNAAYTLGFGPQIGPRFESLDQRYETRHYYTLINGKRREEKVGENSQKIIDSRFTWAGIAGKYFTAMVVPDGTLYGLAFSSKNEPGLPAASRFYLIRPAMDSAGSSDVFHFYLGPKNQENLGRYDTGNNGFKLRDLEFTKAASTSGFLSPLEALLKLLLQFFYRLIPNYGVAIILLTLLVKILLFPLTKKSSEMSVKMQALTPKIKELQEKYRDNPAKLNAEMGALYKKEGHNPLSGCLPLLIQMPILFAMYNLFNTHFDLRGAMFLPGWIPDLSLPESVWDFAHPLPLLGWTGLRLLPFIYLGSQLLYGLATRTPDQQGNPSMKMFMYAMPIMFFFILYNVPSGLLVFWIMSNLFTLVQQIILNKYLAAHRPVPAEPSKPPVIAPRRKKRR